MPCIKRVYHTNANQMGHSNNFYYVQRKVMFNRYTQAMIAYIHALVACTSHELIHHYLEEEF